MMQVEQHLNPSSSMTLIRQVIRKTIVVGILVSIITMSPYHESKAWAFSQTNSCGLTTITTTSSLYMKQMATRKRSLGSRVIDFDCSKMPFPTISQIHFGSQNEQDHHEQKQNAFMGILETKGQGGKKRKKVVTIQSFMFSLSILLATTFFQPQLSIASESNNLESIETKVLSSSPSPTSSTSSSTVKNNRSRYWSLINSDDKEQIITANEKLMDYAVGTINTMYYDNSGGAFFSPKDLYDRWRVLRVYAKEGVDGVKDLIAYSDVKKVSPNLEKDKLGNDDTAEDNYDDSIREKFKPQLFLVQDDKVKVQMNHWRQGDGLSNNDDVSTLPPHAFDSREDVVASLKWLVSTLDDPYSKYLTREELQQELNVRDDGFLGLGVIVEGPREGVTSKMSPQSTNTVIASKASSMTKSGDTPSLKGYGGGESNASPLLTFNRVSSLPIVTAIAPNSPAERAGVVVGDRLAAVGSDEFIGLKTEDVKRKFNTYIGAENYFGNPELTIAKPVYRALNLSLDDDDDESGKSKQDRGNNRSGMIRDEVIGYKLSRVRLTTISLQATAKANSVGVQSQDGSSSVIPNIIPSASAASTVRTKGGDSIVQWELLKPNDSIFRKYTSADNSDDSDGIDKNSSFRSTDRVGYIRLTRFSRSSTAGYSNAIEELEKAGAQSYIIDVRNNYGGVIQESMLTAATLLRDPHTVLCYTLNSRGGFTPHDAEEYIVDTRYPGYLLSSESKDVTMEQVKRDSPNFVSGEGWVPPSAYASIREQRMNRGISRTSFNLFGENFKQVKKPMEELKQLRAQKKIVVLMNEGTASAAEVFVSSIHDNGRTVATVGTKTYGKGLIQHTFPLQDGGGLRLSVAEYLTPALQHVTKVGGAQYDRVTGEYIGGGVKPDIFCPSTQGIPSNIGADICVGMALDALEDADARELEVATSSDDTQSIVGRRGGSDGAGGRRRPLTQGILKDDF